MSSTPRHWLFATTFLFTLVSPACILAETIFLKDGNTHSATEMRRDGAFVFLKIKGTDGGLADTLVPLNQVERIEFGESPVLAEAQELARNGDVAGVLEKTAALAKAQRIYADVPGNQWLEVMRLRLPAIALTADPESFAELQKIWTPTGDPELDIAFRLLVAEKTDLEGARTARKALAKPGASTLPAALSWLALGEEALQAKQWDAALHYFLSVEVFVAHQRALQPTALLGAIRAFIGKEERAKATVLQAELKQEYPKAPQTVVGEQLVR